jgi:nitrite reductase (NO-forming)
MRELAMAIVISALLVGGVLLLPYSVGRSPPPQTVAIQQIPPETARPPVEAVQPVAAPTHRHAQNTAQPVAGAGGDPEQGRQVYRKCQACHSLEAGKNSIGPTLAGIMGKKAASDPNYAYSSALRASGLTWDVATLDQYLLDPQKSVPGNKMPFPGLKTENERRDVIAYLASSATAAPAATSPPVATPAPPAPPQRGSVSYIPDIRYTLRSGIAEGRMVFIGSGGMIEGQVNPVLSAAEGQVVQITLINGEGAEHDIVFPDQGAKSPRITGRGSSTTLAFRAERAGDFTYLCSVPGHELAGMKGQFLITPRPPAQTVVEAIISREATDLPPPISARAPQVVRVDLITVELEGRLAEGATFGYWTFNGKVPGPFLRVRVGDTVEVHLKNAADSSMIHSVDFHAATGPGGGAAATQADPGHEKMVKFKALVPGIYVYHCATPMVAHHIANGMYGLILVEPEGGLPPVDHELYVMQGEIYTEAAFGQRGSQEFSVEKLLQERPEYFVFNGSVGALSKLHPMKAKVGDTVRIFFGVGGPNYTSSFHVIGEIFDRVYSLGDLQSPPARGVQTVTVPAGGATIVEFKLDVPGNYILVDHALSRAERGLVGILQVEGDPNPEIFEGKVEPASGH